MNLHSAFAAAPVPILQNFVTIATASTHRTKAFREASRAIREWPPLHSAMIEVERESRSPRGGRMGAGPCCATPAQREYLDALYRYLNEGRFGGRLPTRVHLRLSNRMTSRLGQLVPGRKDGRRTIVEIALNVDLMLAGNGRVRVDTLVHEMAHAADWIFDGKIGHGPTWKAWAERAGCEAKACTRRRIRRRKRGERTVERVPKLPRGARPDAA